ncbi:MAG: MarR family transcriptional regulator [Ruminococcaceae bacterium]|nr:MarR family transcriptional regulator [Oscillospiraceae bacterium]
MVMENFERFTSLIAEINHSIRKLKTEIMSEFDLRSTHLYCLYYLFRDGSLTAKELCDMCAEDKALMSRTIKQLEERGYVERSSKKRYRAALTLTDEGRAVAARAAEYTNLYFMSTREGISDADREVLYRSLNLINDRLAELCDKYE